MNTLFRILWFIFDLIQILFILMIVGTITISIVKQIEVIPIWIQYVFYFTGGYISYNIFKLLNERK